MMYFLLFSIHSIIRVVLYGSLLASNIYWKYFSKILKNSRITKFSRWDVCVPPGLKGLKHIIMAVIYNWESFHHTCSSLNSEFLPDLISMRDDDRFATQLIETSERKREWIFLFSFLLVQNARKRRDWKG